MKTSCVLFLVLSCVALGFAQRVGNPDDTARIERPCSAFNKKCIRKYLAKHSICKETSGIIPNPYLRPKVTYYISRTNLTVTTVEQVIKIDNTRIEEFYINRDTDKLVIAFELRNLSQSSNSTYFRYHRRSKEPVVTVAPASVTFQSVVITAVIPKIDNLQLKKAECTAFVNDANPPTFIGPEAAESSDPQVPAAMADLMSNIPVNVQEYFLTDAAFYAVLYIQYHLCDFGVRVV